MPPIHPSTTRLLALPPSLRPVCFHRLVSTTTSNHASTSPSGSSIDSNEVSHFNALASSWWDPQGPSRLLHLMNPLRHSFIDSCLRSQPDALPPNRKLHYLDVGCGGGIFAESAARLRSTASVTAIDPSSEVLAVARAHARRDPALSEEELVDGAPRRRLSYLNIGIEELPLPGAAAVDASLEANRSTGPTTYTAEVPPKDGYDVLTLFEVLEHVSNPSDFLSALLPHVKPGGWIVLSTIARTWTSWLTTKVAAEEVLRMVPRGTHDWNKYVNVDEVRGWFEQQNSKEPSAGWSHPRSTGVVYIPGMGWKETRRAEEWGNYFFGIRKKG